MSRSGVGRVLSGWWDVTRREPWGLLQRSAMPGRHAMLCACVAGEEGTKSWDLDARGNQKEMKRNGKRSLEEKPFVVDNKSSKESRSSMTASFFRPFKLFCDVFVVDVNRCVEHGWISTSAPSGK
ncbi:hypothetical protein CC2G_005758 [Coprinopsis cinerea AmutBmut pab1-1]|nr:hypothetical protein CC2G_005758 [Coprinopsis cinerea AmutBmut pab1-1]